MRGDVTALLEAISREAKCAFLSDLRQREWWRAAQRAVGNLEAEAYSEAAWREAAFYILQREIESGSAVRSQLRLWRALGEGALR